MTAPIRILGLDHVVLRVADLPRALRFYRDVLGCALERERPDIGLWQLRAGSALIDLVEAEGKLGRARGGPPRQDAANMDHLCLRIEPFDPGAIRAHLAAHGVACGEVESRYGAEGQGPSIYLADPEGNGVELKGPADAPAR